MPPTPKSPAPKSIATRNRILAAALEVFRERGFDSATMREIAATAGVALGAAYYYFDSKDAIVMEFYERSQEDMAPALDRVLASSRTLEQRLRGVVGVKLEYFAPNRVLLGALAAHIDPAQPLSPFGKATAPIRERDIAHFRRAVEDSRLKLPSTIEPYVPQLLWLYQMGIILFWIFDRSPRQRRTAQLFDRSLTLLISLFRIAALPPLRPLFRPAGQLLQAIYGEGQ